MPTESNVTRLGPSASSTALSMPDPAARKFVWCLALGTALLYLAFLPPGIYSIDGNSMLAVAESIVTSHSIVVPAGLGIPGRGGHIFSTWYPLQSVLILPLVFIASFASHFLHVPLHFLAAAAVGVFPALFTAATVAVVALISIQLGSTLHGARRAALCFAGGTIALVYTRTFYADPLLSLLVSTGIYLVFVCSGRTTLLAGLVTLLAVLAKPAGILLAPTLSLYLFLKKAPPRLAFLPVIGGALGLLLYSFYNFFRFGSPLNFGPPWIFSFSRLPEGLAGLLFSPGRGIIWYSPAVALAILGFRKAMKTRMLEALLITALFLGFLVLHSSMSVWHAGWSWGPRYLLPVLPGLMALTGLLGGKSAKTLLVLSSLGFFINAPTLVSYYERYYAEASEQGVSDTDLYWSPSRAPFLHAWGAASREISDARSQDVRDLFNQRGAPSRTIASSRALRVIALWWWVLPVAHIPRAFGIACSLILVICGTWTLIRIRLPYPSSTAGAPPAARNDGARSYSQVARQ